MNNNLSKSVVARYLVDAARHAPSADNSQPFDFVWDGGELAICFSRERGGAGIFGATAHATLLAFGAVVECIAQAAVTAKIEIVWRWADPASGIYARVSIEENPEVEELPSCLPLFQRHTNRFPFSCSSIPDETVQKIVQQNQGRARINVVTSGEGRGELIRLVRIAAESRFCTENLHNWLIGSLRFDVEAVNRGNGLDIATLNLPPGGALFMRLISNWKRMEIFNRFGLYKLLALTETQLLGRAPAIVCILGKDGISDTVDAGRLLTRVWIELNRLGVAVHPYYVLTDQLLRLQSRSLPTHMIERVTSVRDCLPAIIGAEKNEMLHMLLRVGAPLSQVPRSRRLPLGAIFFDKSVS